MLVYRPYPEIEAASFSEWLMLALKEDALRLRYILTHKEELIDGATLLAVCAAVPVAVLVLNAVMS